jgi:tetratricopeptide (TPR) repeat protein
MLNFFTRFFISLVAFSTLCSEVAAQPTLSFDLKKPKKYEEKKLGSEKSADKKFTLPRRFVQNTVTHYNWYYNADNRLNEIVARAKTSHKDDFSELLSFYNYDLDKTSADSSQLDSVLYKSNAGILIHDLRNSWIDNLYMLMGRAYYYKKELDSAYLTFQYINYAFSPKEKDGYDKPIGSNTTDEGATAFSISTKEKNSISQKILSTPPSRNESFIWQVRTYLAKDELAEAASLIETLKADPVFPERLRPDLYEVQAWWFYKQEIYDSAAIYLEKALSNAENKQEEARWEYLIAQLYERSNHPELAQKFYERAIKHTLNPVLEVYARLNAIRQNKGDSNAVRKNLEELLKMARKDRYTSYRDIIYFTAAQIEIERERIPAAKILLLKATEASEFTKNPGQRTKGFLLLGDLSFSEKNYPDAKRFYDSIVTTDPEIKDPAGLEKRKEVLLHIVNQMEIIYRQDSLQRIASLSEAERDAYIKQLVKRLRKQQGLREEEPSMTTNPGGAANTVVADLFDNNTKGEWYFYNPALKSKGYTEFRNKWGNRPNEDNWRRMSAISQTAGGIPGDPGLRSTRVTPPGPQDFSYEGLLKNVPLTPVQTNVSNDSIQAATIQLTTAYLEGLEDYKAVIETLEPFLEKFPATNNREKALFQLYYSYNKTGNLDKANQVLKQLQEKYPGSDLEKLATNSSKGVTSDPLKEDMTRQYDAIYSLFIEGKFEEALLEKKKADSLYKNNYWTPQLLYIESIYYIKQRQDSAAKTVLQQLRIMYPSSPIAEKAAGLLDVLNRRNEIEAYLSNLQVTRPVEDSISIDTTTRKPALVVQPDAKPLAPTPLPPPTKPVEQRTDTIQAKPLPPEKLVYTFTPDLPHAVVVVMNKVDPVYVSESRNAFNRYNKEKFYNKPIEINNVVLNDSTRLVVMSSFENATAALEYLEKTKKVAAREIVPWLPANKYDFIVISPANLEVLITTKNMGDYRKFLLQSFPGKF